MQDSPKIQTIEQLEVTLGGLRAEGKRIVQCHGVFDPLHIGHVRHFEQAKRFGDVLVVTVTPDRFVNKGSHRPVFTEALRAEAIAALATVDYVAINEWPLAVEAIRALRPDVYVKGMEYSEAEKDRTGGITLEEQAVTSVGGRIEFTDDITFSSSNLINYHLQVFPANVSEYLKDFRSKFEIDDVVGYLDRARHVSALVIGEAVIDEYQYCQAIGKSSKDPMLALRHLSLERFAGGILAVANHVANFCDRVGMITFLGSKDSQEEFITQRMNATVDATYLYQRDAPTITKRRLVEEYYFTKLLEVYEMSDGGLDPIDNELLCTTLKKQVPLYDLTIVVDFGHGMVTTEAIDTICAEARVLAVNAQSNADNMGYHTIGRYPRADYVCITEEELRLVARDRHGDIKDIIGSVSEVIGSDRFCVTRGKSGSVCYSKEEGFSETPSFAGEVVDRIGAGDAFLSVTSPCVAVGAPMEVVGFIGNVVGAQAVATVGNRTAIQRMPVVRHIESLLK